ncbi:NINE protein [Hymenobacter montanus]|nr:NINE protein [Hymenobacter montanus]
MRNKTTAALMAFFLGGLGGQYFYLGRVGAGIACVLFCWTFIPCFIAFYHFIKFLLISDAAFDRQYNREHLASMASQQLAAQQATPRQPALTPGLVQGTEPVVHTMTRSAASHTAPASLNLTDELERLFNLKEKGALTEEEYLVRKAKLLA